MSTVMESTIIFVRYIDLENGVCFRYPALLISHYLALVVFKNGLELDIIKPAADLGAYELVYCSNPIFQVGEDWETVLLEASQMTILHSPGSRTKTYSIHALRHSRSTRNG